LKLGTVEILKSAIVTHQDTRATYSYITPNFLSSDQLSRKLI
jgi:hypothetical protein